MGLLQLCSINSCSRGYDYYLDKRVTNISKIEDDEYVGSVKGSNNNIYETKINVDHPRKSSCNCPFAFGTRKICKHMVALYFTCFPKEVNKYKNHNKIEKRRYEQSLRRKELEELKRRSEIVRYVNTLSKEEIKEKLINYMLSDSYNSYNNYNDDEYDYYDYFSNYEDETVSLKLSTVLEGFERISQFNEVFININTNEIIEINDMYPIDELNYEDFAYNDDYIALPSQYELHSYKIMEDYIETLIDNDLINKLTIAIKSKHPFRKFKDTLIKNNQIESWYKFEKEALLFKARDFLLDNDIDYFDDLED